MIHYTLLPEKEALDLKREYHSRIFIVLLFFISCSIAIGIISLFPAYVTSSAQEKDLIEKLAQVKKNKEASGVSFAIKDLKDSSEILNKLKLDSLKSDFSFILEKLTATRSSSITFNSIQISSVVDEQASDELIVQGKSLTRESLLEFKKSLDHNPFFLKVEFPIPDLTKSKDISFAFKTRLKK